MSDDFDAVILKGLSIKGFADGEEIAVDEASPLSPEILGRINIELILKSCDVDDEGK